MFALFASALATLVACPVPGSTELPTQPVAFVAEDPSFEERLELLVERIEQARNEHHIPGLALAVVKGDEVVLARGFGMADVENARPVEADTIFAIGSTTKAFSASLLGMLQDDGKLDFDDPVTKHLPFFELPLEVSDGEDEHVVTLRDLLCHRTGFTRMSMLWAGGQASRQQVLETAVHAEPWAGFREAFYYNNVMFLAAGMAGASAADSDWNSLIQQRIFDPLDMASSTLSIVDAQRDERLALGYEWNEQSGAFVHKKMLNLDTIGPAGSINSNVIDMAQWLRFQLGEGELDGQRLLSKRAIKDTWRSNITVGGDVKYGLGWMLRRHSGQRVIEHGGNINGFAAQVTLFPKQDLGYVLLTNVTATPLQALSIGMVYDTLLGEIAEVDPAAEELDFSEYLGNYRADFASFDGANFLVQVKNGHLAVDVPGQTTFELHSPDEEGKWYFRLTDTIAVSFGRNADGVIQMMRLHQGGMNFELLREGVVLQAEVPLAELEKFLGTYFSEEQDLTVQVVIQNQRLAVDVPDQMVFELRLPDAEGKRYFRITDEIALRFDEQEDGEVASVTFYEREDVRVLQRIGDAPSQDTAPLPTLDEVFELYVQGGRALLLEKHGSFRSTGTVRLAQCGIEGTYTLEARAEPRAYKLSIDFGVFGGMQLGVGEQSAWSFSDAPGFEQFEGQQLQQHLFAHPQVISGNWRENFDSIKVLRFGEFEGRKTLVVELAHEEWAPYTMHLDVESGRLVSMDHFFSASTMQFPVTTSYSDHRDIDGFPTAHSTIEKSDANGRMIYELVDIELGVELAEDFCEYEGEK